MEKEFLNLTIKEKLNLLTGKSFWKTEDIKSLNLKTKVLSDGPHGIRKQSGREDMLGLNESEQAICYPSSALSACSFDNELIYRLGQHLALEAKSKGVDMILGPGMNIKRNPLCGRNFEYFSEDSFLSSQMAGYLSKGIEDMGVSSCLKHFVCNNQENYRMIGNSIVDERTLHELYLKNFGDAIAIANPTAIMTSYNQVNGIYMSENKYLLNYLRKEYNFNGLYVTDWGGISDIEKSFKNGLNLEMPGKDKTRLKSLYKMYKKKILSEDEINNSAYPVYKFLKKESKKDIEFNLNESIDFAKEVAEKSIVLLKNNENILPLKSSDRICVVGQLAKEARYQGSGSSKINPYRVTSLLDALDTNHIEYVYSSGYKDDEIINDYKDNVLNSDKVILVLGLPDSYESEGFDRVSMKLPECQTELLRNIYQLNKNIIVVLSCGGVVELELEYMKALLLTYLGGMEVGGALYEILYGIVNPSGRLAETWPVHIEDLSQENFGNFHLQTYDEGQYIGYKYYHSIHQEINFPFGFGLSYSEVLYRDIKIIDDTIYVTLENIGRTTNEVVQYYLENIGEFNYRRLIGYDKVLLNENEIKTVSFKLNADIFKMYDVNSHMFKTASGEFVVEVAKSSRNILFKEEIKRNGKIRYQIPNHRFHHTCNIVENSKFDMNSTLDDLNRVFIGRLIVKLINKKSIKLAKENPDMALMLNSMLKSTPLKQIPMGTGFKFNYNKVKGLIDLLNGKIFKGIIGLLK